MEWVSLFVGIISIVLAICSIALSIKYAHQSTQNYQQAKDLLSQVENKTESIDRAIQFEQKMLIGVINKMLDKIGESPIAFTPISIEDIDRITKNHDDELMQKLNNLETAVNNIPRVHIRTEPNVGGGNTLIIE